MTDPIVSNFIELYQELIDSSSHLAVHNFRCENSDYSDQLIDSKNAYVCFNGDGVYDCYYTWDSRWIKNCVDCDMTHRSELTYEAIEDNQNYNCNFLYWSADLNNCEFMMYCFNCDDCFGCFNLKRKKYHILNKPYEKAKYFILVSEIKKSLREKNRYMNFLPDIIRR